VTDIILDTDMSKHFAIQAQFDKFDFSEVKPTDDQIKTLMRVVVHACDISNPTMNFADFKEWGLRITQEFDDLFVAEKHLSETRGTAGPLPFLEYKGYKGFCFGQIGFTSKFTLIFYFL
jgi:hypothetical protein